VSLKRAVDEGRTPGPRFLIAGPYLDGDASRNPMSLKVGTPEAARRAVRYWSEEGATWIKFLGAETREVLRAAIEEAHARGLRVTGQAGFTPEQAIEIMTLNGARILGEEQRVGSIATGKRADLMVVRGDPVRTPAEIYDVVTVFKDGVGYDSIALRDAARGMVGLN